MYQAVLSKKAQKDRTELERSGFKEKIEEIFRDLSEHPFSPRSKKLKGDVSELYSRRLSIKDRAVLKIGDLSDPKYEGVVTIIRMRTHYKGVLPAFLL